MEVSTQGSESLSYRLIRGRVGNLLSRPLPPSQLQDENNNEMLPQTDVHDNQFISTPVRIS